MNRVLIPLVGTLLLGGCSETPPRKTPAPVYNASDRLPREARKAEAPVTREPAEPQKESQAYPSLHTDEVPGHVAPETGNRRPGAYLGPSARLPSSPPMQPPLEEPMALREPESMIRSPRELESTAPHSGRTMPPTSPFADELEMAEPLGIATRTVADDPDTTVYRYESTKPSAPSPAHSRAVTTLLAIANRQEEEGQFGAAALQVERAIDLESRNADLWYQLAKLRLAEGKLQEAEQAARTSLQMAGGNLPLQRNNWRLLSEVRFELGDTTGGERAARKVEELY